MTSADPPSVPQGTSEAVRTSARGRAADWIHDHMDAVFRYARRRLGPEDAEDVTQQAFAALCQAEAAGRAPDVPGAYLLGVARRRIADLCRTRGRRRTRVGLPEGWEGLAETPLPDEVIASEEVRELVQVALGLLPGVDRGALLAYYREGVPVAEVGRRLDVSEKAAEMRLRRARRAFVAHYAAVGRDWLEAGPSASAPPGDPAEGGRS